MNTDTPQTDAIDTYRPFIVSEPKYNAMAELCRTFERELAAEQEKVKRLREALELISKSEQSCDSQHAFEYMQGIARATLESTK